MSASAPVASAEAPVAVLPAPMSPPLSVWILVGVIVGIEIVVLILVPLLAQKGNIVGIGIGIGIVAVVVVVRIFKYKNRKWETVQERLRMENNNGHSHAPPQVSISSADSSTMDPESTERPDPPPSPGIPLGYSLRKFSCEELERATNGFSNVNLLGRGGFGNVYKGVLPVPDEKVIAVKQLKSGSKQGDSGFETEVEVISRVHHKNLVSLVGYCIDGDQRMLVYEFIPNKTLDFHLHGEGSQPMDWPTRMKIALGSAEGLAYLHEGCQPKIIHRDIKPTNILLDDNFVAKIADFGLAKSSSEIDTHVSTLGRGTYGYMDMEYANSKKLTEKSDIFSFGVVLLELITGKKPFDESRSSVERAEALEKGNFDELVDPRLQNDYDSSAMTRMVACAAACVRQSGRRRPRMSQIIQALKGNISLDALDKDIPPENS